MGQTKANSADAMILLEEASNSRSMLARDDYDARHWKDEVADTREQMASSHSIVLSAINGETPTDPNLIAGNSKPVGNPPVTLPPVDTKTNANRDREVDPVDKTPSDSATAQNDKPAYVPAAMPVAKEVKQRPKTAVDTAPKTDTPKTEIPKSDAPKDNTPLNVGSLIGYATRQMTPVYPPAAKSVRTTGIVRVEVTVDEKGDVTEVQKTSGPPMLQGAAKDAIKKWKFKPFVRDGQPVRATGFVSFNFAL